MVYIAPPPGGARGKGGGNKNGVKANRQGRGKDRDALASKADLLAQLTRQAEEHTRILERERAALGLPGRAAPTDDQPQSKQDQRQQRGGGAQGKQRRRNNNHIYTDQGNKKVFDPSQIPGLGGGGDGPSGSDQLLEQTFPDSPNFYPGRVFAIPGTIPQPPNQANHARPDGGTIVIAPWGGDGEATGQQQRGQPGSPGARGAQRGMPPQQAPGPGMPQGPRGAPGMGQPPPGMGMPPPGMGLGQPGMGPPPPQGMGGPPGGMMGMPPPQGFGGQPPSGGYGPPPGAMQGPPGPMGGMPPGYGPPPPGGPFMGPPGGGFDPAAMDPRVAARMEADAKKEAYRRELEEQIRAKKMAKEAEERKRREEDALWEARAAAAPQPWDPEARAARRGGGGDPIRDEFGRPVANLRQRGGPGSPGAVGGPGMGPSPFMGGPFPGSPGPAWPGGSGPYPGGPYGPGPDGPPPGLGGPMPPPPLVLGGLPSAGSVPFEGPPNGHMSPGSIPPVSPGNRRFMAAMNDLIAGPTDEQRRQKEMARQRLQMDLEEQIREKKERQARERAAEERERLKEEADMKAYYDNVNAQRQAELQRAAGGGPPGPGMPGQPPDLMGAPPPLPPRRHGKGKVIDASWLDAPKPPVLPPLGSPAAAQYGRRSSAGAMEDLGPPAGMSPRPGAGAALGRGPSNDGGVGGGAGGRGTVTTLLHQLQEEQSRIREDFARQAAAMEKLASDASRALVGRDEARRELHKVRSMLSGEASPPSGGGSPGPGGSPGAPFDHDDEPYAATTVIVETHMVPKEVNSIPDELPAPVSSEVLRRGQSDAGPRAGLGAGLGPVRRGWMDDGPGVGPLGPEDLEELQAHINRGSPGPGGKAGAHRQGRSGIPLPPGMSQPTGSPGARIQSVYGGFEKPPKSRYNSFFGLDGPAGGKSPPGGRGGGGGGGGALPAIAPSRKPPPIKPPASPPILRADHLPSPVKQGRGGGSGPADPRAIAGSRVRSGRVGGGPGILDRPPRVPRAASALAAPTPRSPNDDFLPPVPHAASRRSLDDMQQLLRRGHEDRLLRGAGGLSNDLGSPTGSGVGAIAAAYRTQELRALGAGRGLPLIEDLDIDRGSSAGSASGLGLGMAGPRARGIREASLQGQSEVMTPSRAADYLRGSSGGVGGGAAAYFRGSSGGSGMAGGLGVGLLGQQPRFHSDSITSYRSMLTPLSSSRGTQPVGTGTGPVAGSMEPGNSTVGGGSSITGGKEGGSGGGSGSRSGGGGTGGDGSERGSEVGLADKPRLRWPEYVSVSVSVPGLEGEPAALDGSPRTGRSPRESDGGGGGRVGRVSGGGGAWGGAGSRVNASGSQGSRLSPSPRASDAGAAGHGPDDPNIPIQRPVMAGRRLPRLQWGTHSPRAAPIVEE